MAAVEYNAWSVCCLVFVFRWTVMQCSPVFSGNFTPSGHTVTVKSGHKVATMEGFTFVVRNAVFGSALCGMRGF